MRFYARLILSVHQSERGEAGLAGVLTSSPAWACAGSQAHGAGCLQWAAFGKQSWVSLWLYLPEWPQLPQALPVLLRQYTLYKPRDGISMRSTEVCFSKSGIWLKDWLREWPSSWLYLWFLLISLRSCWRPPWAFRIHLTFRHHHSSKDGLMRVWSSPEAFELGVDTCLIVDSVDIYSLAYTYPLMMGQVIWISNTVIINPEEV